MNRKLYARRRLGNGVFVALSIAAAGFGIGWLALILGTLVIEGASGMSATLFTLPTPPPGSGGGVSNAIFGSLVMSAIAVAVGTPIGIFAGTWLAEYGRHARLALFVRFINDILLSAPSILIGLFIYEL